jgi:predicted nucleic acid-binding protein
MVIDTNVLLYYLDGRAPVVQLLDRLARLGSSCLTR